MISFNDYKFSNINSIKCPEIFNQIEINSISTLTTAMHN